MYVILTSKPGQFRTEITEGLKPIEAYDSLVGREAKPAEQIQLAG